MEEHALCRVVKFWHAGNNSNVSSMIGIITLTTAHRCPPRTTGTRCQVNEDSSSGFFESGRKFSCVIITCLIIV